MSERKDRDKHCGNSKLNKNGRCIAYCAENILREYEADCTGATGVTSDYESSHEVPVSSGFIDGRNRVLDSKGYQIAPDKPTPADEAPVKIVSRPGETPDEIAKMMKMIPKGAALLMDNNGDYYFWDTTTFGVRFKNYLKPISQRKGRVYP